MKVDLLLEQFNMKFIAFITLILCVFISGPLWLVKAVLSDNYKQNKELWHGELKSDILTLPLFWSMVTLFCDGDESKMGY